MARRQKGGDAEWESLAPRVQEAFAEAHREVVSGYFAGENSRYLPTPPGISVMGSGADYHYRNETQFLRMIERARFFDRDNMVVGQGVTRLVANVMQDGFTLDPQTGDKSLDAELRDRWWDWASDPSQCDYEGERDWSDFELMSLRHEVVDGDICCLPMADGSLWWHEAHGLRNPYGSAATRNVVHGVELDSRRRRVAYNFLPTPISPLSAVAPTTQFFRVAARDQDGYRQVLHQYQPKRFSQARGVTAFAPIVLPIQYHEDLQFATLLKAKVASFVALFREYSTDAEVRSNRQGGPRTQETQADGSNRTVEQTGLATTVRGDPGETLKGFAPNIPNPEFFPHAALILSFVAINLDLPLCVFLLDPTKTNFSGWRGAIDQARQRFRQIQSHKVRKLHTPVYEWKVRQWIAADPAMRAAAQRGSIKIFGHRWNPPRWPYIEPMKDAAAADLRVTRNLASARQVFSESGFEYDETVNEIVGDRVMLIEKACEATVALNEKFPFAKIDWREIAYGRASDATTMSIAAMEQAQSVEDDDRPASPDEQDDDEDEQGDDEGT